MSRAPTYFMGWQPEVSRSTADAENSECERCGVPGVRLRPMLVDGVPWSLCRDCIDVAKPLPDNRVRPPREGRRRPLQPIVERRHERVPLTEADIAWMIANGWARPVEAAA